MWPPELLIAVIGDDNNDFIYVGSSVSSLRPATGPSSSASTKAISRIIPDRLM